MSDVEGYLTRAGIAVRRSGGDQLVMSCPACGKEGKAYVHRITWLWDCKVCGAKGNEITLKRSMGHLPTLPTKAATDTRPGMISRTPPDKWKAAAKALWTSEKAQEAVGWLSGRGLSEEVLRGASVGWVAAVGRTVGRATGPGWVSLPGGEGAKCRALDPDSPTRYMMQGSPGLYAPFGIEPTTLVICGGEIDALSWAEAGHRNVVSSMVGEGAWKDEWTVLLSECDDIVVVYDEDTAGQEGAAKLAGKLGRHRARIGHYPDGSSDANEALVAGLLDPATIIAAAGHIVYEGITTVEAAGKAYLEQLRNKVGIKGRATGWQDLDRLLGGWRDGELTLVTGDTGCGKTTMASQAGLYQAEHGTGVLYCPFELGPVRQVGKWCRQMLEGPPIDMDIEHSERVVRRMGTLPLWMYQHRGPLDAEVLRAVLLYSIHRLGCTFIVLDHLHFVVLDGRGERAHIDQLMKVCAEVVVDTGAHILALAHPAKMARDQGDNAIVQANDLKGSSGLKQIADNVLSVWRPRKKDRGDVVDEGGLGASVIYVLKCRSEYGQEGAVALIYDPVGALLKEDNTVTRKPDGGLTINVGGRQ